ncbi:efflux RND transporter permease subunit [Campylobacter sp. RM16192]|uniref:efflux RND transporter permease subunit n=1 Tax=Campylobacter sp. RM16192 TaxID=1660080 RepID=UPI0014523C82|nr:multidrug efflux RND transporter permease subunit [Campylobacter sp. RM16192]QCD53371.1 multidrug efflux system CmeABC, inner membrane drug transporter CmeB [Campylobacter sp. RM16192]
MFSKFFIDRPIFATVVSIIIVIAGSMAIKGLPVEEYPQLTPPQISVSASYTGADAQTIADSVATVIEDQINGVENMLYMQSTSSSSGTMGINVYFKIGADSKQAAIDVNNRVQAALAKLPSEVQQRGVTVRERSSSILEVISFTSEDMDIIKMHNYVLANIEDEIKRVDGVGDTAVIGTKDYAMRIWLKPDLLAKFNISTSEVITQINQQNKQYATGKIGEQPNTTDNPYVFSIRPEGRLKSVQEFENIVLRTSKEGTMLKLKDVAKVELGARSYVFEGMLNGQKMVPMLIFLQNGANALATANAVNKKLDELSKNFPTGFKHTVAYNPTDFIQVSINEVMKTFLEAMVLVMVVIYMFLKSFRATIIPMLAVPVSIIGTFAGLYAMGFTINLITLFALVLAIGIVVDDAIIVIENIERILHEEDISVRDAAIKAMQEVSAPVVSIVLVLSAVFIPVAFMEGFVGVIQRQFALTLVVSVCISGFVALTLTPALCVVMLKKQESQPFWFVRKFNEFFDWSTSVFTAGVAKVLRHIIPSFIAIGIMGYAIFVLFNSIPGSLVPAEDKGSIIAITSLPPASVMERTKKEMKDISEAFTKNPNVEFATGLVGYDMFAGALKENSAVAFIRLKDWSERKSADSSASALVGHFNKIFWGSKESMTFVVNVPPITGLSITGGFDMYLLNKTGKTYNEIEKDALKVVAAANARPELTSVRTTLETTYPQYNLTVDKQKAKLLGVSEPDIFSTIAATIGSYYVNDFNMLGKSYNVYVRAVDTYRNSPEDFRNIFVKSNSGEMIPLNSLVTLKRGVGPDIVDRFNLFPAAKIMGDPKPGYTSGDAIKAISEVVAEQLSSDEYSISWSGSAYQEVSSQGTGTTAFIFGMVFVFLILAAQYERWLIPLAVITAVPFAVFGSLVAVWARGLTNDIYFQIGLLLLIGLSAKNAILIVEFAMQERESGKSAFEAAVNAAKLRFRPIVMTSIAFTLGVFPMVISTGAGAASRHALGTGVIGGMIAATTIAIFFVPMFYYLLENLNNKFWDKKPKIKESAHA